MAASTVSNSISEALLLSADDAFDASTWDALVDTASTRDVYYRPAYARAYQEIGHGRAVAFVVEIPGVRALFPLLLRPLQTLPFTHSEQGWDAATPYGYGGILLLDGLESLDVDQGRALLNQFRARCRKEGIISAYVRLQPVTHQAGWFSKASEQDVEMLFHGPTTAIDVSAWNSDTGGAASLRRGRRNDLNLARRNLHLTWTSQGRDHGQDLSIFYKMYEQRMAELGAGDYYHFPLAYYDALAQGLGERLEVAIAWLGERPVGAALFLIEGTLAQYHLSATDDVGRKLAANTLILDGAAMQTRSRNCAYLHLGGGLNGEDQLFAFKASFGGPIFRYVSLGVVCDAPSYRDLLECRERAPGLPAIRPGFFPHYRA